MEDETVRPNVYNVNKGIIKYYFNVSLKKIIHQFQVVELFVLIYNINS